LSILRRVKQSENMKLPIFSYGHPIFKEEVKPVSNKNPDLQKLIRDMKETLFLLKSQILIASQVGYALQLFIVDFSTKSKRNQQVFINPAVVSESGTMATFMESDLSIPNIEISVDRLSNLQVKYLDENLDEQVKEFSGQTARYVQHGMDFMKNQTMIDQINSFRYQSLSRALHQISKGKITTPYKMVYPESVQKPYGWQLRPRCSTF